MSIRRKLLIAALIACMTVAAIGTGTMLYVKQALQDEVRTGTASLAEIESKRVEQQLEAMTEKLRALTTARGFGDLVERVGAGDPGALVALRNATVAAPIGTGGLVSARVYASDGTLLATSNPRRVSGPAPAIDGALVERAAELDAPGARLVGTAVAEGTPDGSYAHAVGIFAGSRQVGVLVAQCSLTSLTELVVGHSGVGPSAEAHIVQPTDRGAQFITPLRFDPAGRWSKIIPFSKAEAPAIRALSGDTGPVDDLRDYRQEPVLAAFERIAGTPWALVVKIDLADAYSGVRRVLWALALAFGVAIALLAASAFGVSRTVVRRIRRATESATAISRGDLGVRVGGHTRDEVGRFAAAFDRMADALAEDIERRERIEAQLEHMARHDQLTGLSGRTSFEDHLAAALAGERPSAGEVALLFCDLDDFKSVNDRLGHAAGDDLLRVVAQRFQAVLRPDDLLARFGGDEFVVVCRALGTRADAEAVASRLQSSLDDPIQIGESEVRISVSIGISISTPGVLAEEMLRLADEDMYGAKARGREGLLTGDARISARRDYGLSLSGDLRQAIDKGELSLEFQPIVGLATGSIVALETLVRWDRDGMRVAAADFVEYASALGLAESLDRWVVTNAVRQFARWRADEEIEPVNLAINISPESASKDRVASALIEEIERLGLPASSLCLEITEGVLATGTEEVLASLRQLRSHGVRLAIDDFGIGHSSLARLRDLAVDTVKLDKALVRDVDHDEAARSIVSAVVALAGALGLVVAAEGIEREGQRDVLADLGCQLGQGLLFAPPEPPDLVRRRLLRTRPADTGLLS